MHETSLSGLTTKLPTTIDTVGKDELDGDIAILTIYLNTAFPHRQEQIEKVKVGIERPRKMPLEKWEAVVRPDNGVPALRLVEVTAHKNGLVIGDIGLTPDYRINAHDPRTFHFAAMPDA